MGMRKRNGKMTTGRSNDTVDDNSITKPVLETNKKEMFPPLAGVNKKEEIRKVGLFISIHLEIYQNVKWFRNLLQTLSLSDLKRLPYNILENLLAKDAKQRRVHISLSRNAWIWFLFVFMLTVSTRLYQVDQPAHIW